MNSAVPQGLVDAHRPDPQTICETPTGENDQ